MLLILSTGLAFSSALIFSFLYFKQYRKSYGIAEAETLITLLGSGLQAMTGSRNFGDFLQIMNERAGTRIAILAVFADGRLIDLQFKSRDPETSFSLPQLEIFAEGFPSRVTEMLDRLSVERQIPHRGSGTSLFGNLRFENGLSLGFTHEGRLYAVLQFLDREKPFSYREMSLVRSVRTILRSVTLDYSIDLLRTEKRRKAEIALRQSEERYRAIFDDSMDLIYHTDSEGTVLAINGAGIRLLGYSSEEEIVGRNLHEFFFDGEQRDFYLELIRQNGYIKDMEVILVTRAGEKIFSLESSSASFDGSGSVRSYTGIIKDISARVNLDRELWRTNLELTETNTRLKETQAHMVQSEKLASIGQLAAGLAHEINNPLGFVRGNYSAIRRYCDALLLFADQTLNLSSFDAAELEELRRRHRIDAIRSDIDAVFGETSEGMDRIMEIVQNLRSFSHSDRPGVTEKLDFNQAVENTLVIARNEIKYHAAVSLDLKPLPPIECHPGEIRQVLLNIIVNAAQALKSSSAENGGGEIRIATEFTGSSIRCTVDDSGPGIPAELRHRIFDPFFSTKDVGSGTGLGLSISHDIVVNKHGGTLEALDSPLGGARFVLLLPAADTSGDGDLGSLEEIPPE